VEINGNIVGGTHCISDFSKVGYSLINELFCSIDPRLARKTDFETFEPAGKILLNLFDRATSLVQSNAILYSATQQLPHRQAYTFA